MHPNGDTTSPLKTQLKNEPLPKISHKCRQNKIAYNYFVNLMLN